ncbi:hypothetical protein MKX01_015145 [Papaver californicum]|nr:hypothetical protein MKX01_015145 [Papaver californicum]
MQSHPNIDSFDGLQGSNTTLLYYECIICISAVGIGISSPEEEILRKAKNQFGDENGRGAFIYPSIEETMFMAERGVLLLIDSDDVALSLKDMYKMLTEPKNVKYRKSSLGEPAFIGYLARVIVHLPKKEIEELETRCKGVSLMVCYIKRMHSQVSSFL